MIDASDSIIDDISSASQIDKPGLDNARLKYIIYRSKDLSMTAEFYESLGMSVEFNISHENKSYLCMNYKTSNADFNESSASLLFLETKDNSNRKLSNSRRPSLRPISKTEIPLHHDTHHQYGHRHMVIYVHLLSRIVKRMESKGIYPIHESKQMNDLTMAIFKDPNGIEIRLVELSQNQMTDSTAIRNPTQWFARWGYCVVSVPSCGTSISFHERTLSVSKQTNRRYDRSRFDASTIYEVSYRKNENREFVSHRNGFHVVDSEILVTGLSYIKYFWLGNDIREKTSSVCFIENIQGAYRYKSFNYSQFKDPHLIGFGFVVPVLETAAGQLVMNFPDLVKMNDNVEQIPDLGFCNSFKDPMNYSITLFSSIGYLTMQNHEKKTKKTEKKLTPLEKFQNRVNQLDIGLLPRGLHASCPDIKKLFDSLNEKPEREWIDFRYLKSKGQTGTDFEMKRYLQDEDKSRRRDSM